MGQLSINGTFSTVPDPDWASYGVRVVGAFVGGVAVRQGYESGLLSFPPLSSAARNELYSRYMANRNSIVSGQIPQNSGYGWQFVSANFWEPLPTGYDGEWAHGVRMMVYRVQRF